KACWKFHSVKCLTNVNHTQFCLSAKRWIPLLEAACASTFEGTLNSKPSTSQTPAEYLPKPGNAIVASVSSCVMSIRHEYRVHRLWLRRVRFARDPDKRVQQAIQLVFTKFAELQSARQVHIWLRDEGIELPAKSRRGEAHGVVWRLPAYNIVH